MKDTYWTKTKLFLKKTWNFLWNDDSALSWFASLIVAFILIKFIIYPGLGLIFGTNFPIVAVVSNSMEHDSSFDIWWAEQEDFYLQKEITKEEFLDYPFKNGFNKGDIMILIGANPDKLSRGEILVFWSRQPYPIIHRIVGIDVASSGDYVGQKVFETKGDHNRGQAANPLLDETHIKEEQIVGKAVLRIPWLGYVKIWFVDLINVLMNLFFGHSLG